MIARMWEARVEPGRLAECLSWLRPVARSAEAAGATAAELFRAEGRAVLITRWPAPPEWREPEPPRGVVVRAHAWEFEQVAR